MKASQIGIVNVLIPAAVPAASAFVCTPPSWSMIWSCCVYINKLRQSIMIASQTVSETGKLVCLEKRVERERSVKTH